MAVAAWPRLVSPEAGQGLEAGLGTILWGMAPAENQGEGIAHFIIPHPSSYQKAWVGQCQLQG